MRTRPLGPGPTTLLEGNDMYGYYGKYQGIITPNELIALASITEGQRVPEVVGNEFITWLKFSHNYKSLFIADKPIYQSISWNHLETLKLIFGKVIKINEQKYLLRIPQGANKNPAEKSGEMQSNSEWDSLIRVFAPDDAGQGLNNGSDVRSWCQETRKDDINTAVDRLNNNSICYFFGSSKNDKNYFRGYRPVLEVL